MVQNYSNLPLYHVDKLRIILTFLLIALWILPQNLFAKQRLALFIADG